MADIKGVYRTWLGFTTAFVLLSACISPVAIGLVVRHNDEQRRHEHESLVERAIFDEDSILRQALAGDTEAQQELQRRLTRRLGDSKVELSFSGKKSETAPTMPLVLAWNGTSSSANTSLFHVGGETPLAAVEMAGQANFAASALAGQTSVIWEIIPPLASLAGFVLVATWLVGANWLKRELLLPYMERSIEIERAQATFRTTQMLAHDIRKPFSMLRNFLAAVDAVQDPVAMAALVQRYRVDANDALTYVDGMLADVMTVGSDAPLVTTPAAPEALVEAALREAVRLNPNAKFTIDSNFANLHQVEVDEGKIRRVFTNIITNAVQAMGANGELWLHTREVVVGAGKGQRFCEFTIGNSGSLIASEDLPKLFDLFYTKGKAGGTGLGLAIVKKIVTAHGGDIWCTSSADVGTEFHFRLPSAAQRHRRDLHLPHSSEALKVAPPLSPASTTTNSPAAVVAMAARRKAPQLAPLQPFLALVDDCVFVRESWLAGAQAEGIELVTFASPEAFWAFAAAEPRRARALAAVISDFHFAPGTEGDGSTFAAAVAKTLQLPVYLCSDDPTLGDLFPELFVAALSKDPESLAALRVPLAKAL